MASFCGECAKCVSTGLVRTLPMPFRTGSSNLINLIFRGRRLPDRPDFIDLGRLAKAKRS